jgi:hypothetical protein
VGGRCSTWSADDGGRCRYHRRNRRWLGQFGRTNGMSADYLLSDIKALLESGLRPPDKRSPHVVAKNTPAGVYPFCHAGLCKEVHAEAADANQTPTSSTFSTGPMSARAMSAVKLVTIQSHSRMSKLGRANTAMTIRTARIPSAAPVQPQRREMRPVRSLG